MLTILIIDDDKPYHNDKVYHYDDGSGAYDLMITLIIIK